MPKLYLKNRKEIDAWRDQHLAEIKERDAQLAKEYREETEVLVELYATATGVLRMLTKFPNYAAMVQEPNAPTFYDHYSTPVIHGFEKHLWAKAKTSMRQADDLQAMFEDKYTDYLLKIGGPPPDMLDIAKRVREEEAVMHAIHYIYLYWRHAYLNVRFRKEPNAAWLVKTTRAKRLRDASNEKRNRVVESYYKNGGVKKTLTDRIYDGSFATSDPNAASAVNAYAAFCAYLEEQRIEGEARVGAMVGRVIAAVKKRQGEEHRAALKQERQERLEAEAARKAKGASQPPSSSPPSPPPSVDPKAKALEAVRKLNREKALRTETLLAQRRRAAKALEAEEKLAQAAEARASAKTKGARVSR